MKSSLLKLAVAATAFTAAASAQASDFEIGVGVPFYSFENKADLEDQAGVNLNIGYRFNQPFGIELSGSYLQTETSSTNINNLATDVDITDIKLDGLWYLNNEGKVLPYTVLGLGLLNTKPDGFESVEEETVSFGMGLKAHLSPRFRARVEGRLLHHLDSHLDNSILTLGLGYVFGASTPAAPAPKVVEPVFADADGDGVEDSVDRCASTPAGASVDASGCALDSDNDGVADYLDNCPDTDRKLKVDASGCPVVLTEDVSIDLDVKFASGSDVVPSQYFSEIRGVARFMEQYENSEVTIEGHTDTSGSASFNKTLSQKRANAVASVLTSQYGIESSRVRAIGYGEERPLVQENTKADQALNRRVVAKVSAKKTVIQPK